MPGVGDKKYPYTKEGIAAAEAQAEVTGEEVIPTYDAGGRVENYQLGGIVDRMSGQPGGIKKVPIKAVPGMQSPLIRPPYKKGGKVKK